MRKDFRGQKETLLLVANSMSYGEVQRVTAQRSQSKKQFLIFFGLQKKYPLRSIKTDLILVLHNTMTLLLLWTISTGQPPRQMIASKLLAVRLTGSALRRE